jgi:hypothetical protein
MKVKFTDLIKKKSIPHYTKIYKYESKITLNNKYLTQKKVVSDCAV